VIDVVLAEDHRIVREGLRALLDADDGIRVVGEASNGREAVALAKELRPGVVVMDLSMPGLNGVDATQRIVAACPATRVVVLSMHADDAHVRPALRAGAKGYLVKGSGLDDLREAILEVACGRSFHSPAVQELLERAPRGHETRLTTREREVLQLVAEGYSSPAIAKELGLSVKTVETHRGKLMTKLEASNVAGLVRAAVKMGLVD